MTRVLATLLLSLLLQGPARAAEGDPKVGLSVAVKWCAKCHVIGDHNPYGGINSTPSFWLMAKKWDRYEERLRTFRARRPHPSIGLDITDQDVANLLSYVGSLPPP